MKFNTLFLLVLIAITAVVFSIRSPHFLDLPFLLHRSTLFAEIGLLALGMTFVIISGQIDLSVGSNLVLSACILAKLLASGLPIPLAIALTVVIGGLLGILNGLLVAYLKLPSFLVTLGTMAFYRGIAQAMMGPKSVPIPPSLRGIDWQTFAGLPWPIVIFAVGAIGLGLLLARTTFGRWVYAVGTNLEASSYSGVPVERVQASVFLITGLLAGIGAVQLDSRLGVARHNLMNGAELDAITMVVFGGASIYGGKGKILCTALAFVFITLLKTGFGVVNVRVEYQLTWIGLLLIAFPLAIQVGSQMRTQSKIQPVHSTGSKESC